MKEIAKIIADAQETESFQECAKRLAPIFTPENFLRRYDTDRDFRNPLSVPTRLQQTCSPDTAPEWEYIAGADSLETMLRRIEHYKVGSKFPFKIGGSELRVSEIRNYLMIESGSAEWQKEIQLAKDMIGKEQTQIDEAIESYRAIGSETDKGSATIFFDKLAAFLWSYILITTLGMKLARRPYIYRKIGR
jgi:hypothetical protein